MSYLYGDSTPTDLKSNFLEFLRDAIDFAVFVLEADASIKHGHVRIQKNTEAMEAEIGRLEHFIGVVTQSIRAAEKGMRRTRRPPHARRTSKSSSRKRSARR
jgi:hypothetical protein